MPHTDAKLMYQVQLTAEEYRLVVLALAGKLQDLEDVKDALSLNTQLCRQRALSLKSQTQIAFESAKQAELLENPNHPPTEYKL